MAATDPAFRFASRWAEARPAVEGYFAALVADRHAVDDLVQEVALAAYEGFTAYDEERPFRAWVLGIARHKLFSRWRDLARGRLVVGDPARADTYAALAIEMEDELAEERSALRACLERLQGRAWAILRARYEEGLADEAVAERFATTAGNVRVLLHRVRATLRACIQRRLAGGAGG